MTKAIYIILGLLFFSININAISTTNASISKIALEISRSKNIDLAIKRVNNIYDYINLYIMQTALVPADYSELIAKYPNIVNKGYTSSNLIDFSISSNIVTFTNIVPTNITGLTKQLYINNSNLNANAIVNTSTLNIAIGLETSTRKFISKNDLIIANDASHVISIQDNAIACANVAHVGNMWYRPDGYGKYFIYTCTYTGVIFQREYIGNRIDMSLYRNTVSELNSIKALDGTKAYIKNGPGTVNEYIYGDDGNGATIDWRKVSTP